MSSHRNWLRYGPTRSPDVSPRNTVAGVHFVPVGGERFGESVYVGDGGCNERVCVINAERHSRVSASQSANGPMHGKLALYHPQYGVIPIAVSLLAIIWTTIFLTWIQTYLVADDVEDLALVG